MQDDVGIQKGCSLQVQVAGEAASLDCTLVQICDSALKLVTLL